MSNHPPHILEKDEKTLSPSAFIPFCSFIGNWSLTGVMTDTFRVPVCNIFEEVVLDGKLCYQADVHKLKKQVDWDKEKEKIVTSGFMFMLDYNEERGIQEVSKDKKEERIGYDKLAMVYIDTLGKKN